MSRTPWQGSNRRSQLPPDWAKIRLRILERDGHQCTHTEKGRRCTARATDVHHLHGRNDHSDRNLASLCRPHHNEETTREAAAARARPPLERPAQRHPGLTEGVGGDPRGPRH